MFACFRLAKAEEGMFLFNTRNNKNNVASGTWTAVHSLALLHLPVLLKAKSPQEKMIRFGKPVKIETMPHSVAIIIAYEWPGDAIVGSGSIIDHRWVLTAAHCFDDFFKYTPTKSRLVKIRFGMNSYLQEGPVSDVIKIICHERWGTKRVAYDICLVQTIDEIPFSDRVQPALRPLANETVDKFDEVIVAGWGSNEKVAFDVNYLSAVDLLMITDDECGREFGLDLRKQVPGSFFCAGKNDQLDAKSVCYGDSGSSAVVRRGGNGSWVTLGVTAVALVGCGGVTLFISVSYFNDWITDTLNKYR